MLSGKLKSKWWRLNHLYKIKNKQGKIVIFHPNPIQKRYKYARANFNYGYIVKSRQLGFTTDAAIDMLDDACFVPGASAGIIAHDRETLGKIFQIIKRAYENMPKELRPEAQYDTRNEYKFKKRFDGVTLDNEIYVALDIRGTTVQRLHISEAAFIKDRGKLKMGAKQAVPVGGRITEETTGNGMGEFYDDVMEALTTIQSGKATPQTYRVYFYAWFENPEYTLPGTLPEPDVQRYGDESALKGRHNLNDGQLLWRRWKLDEFRTNSLTSVGLNVFQRFRQEYPATLLEAFQSAAGNVFELEQLMALSGKKPLDRLDIRRIISKDWEYLGEYEREILLKAQKDAEHLIDAGVNIWHLPQPGKKYVIGVDPAGGEDSSDNTDIDVWEIPKEATQPLIQVAQYYGKIRPDNGADLCVDIAKIYNDAFVGVENNMLSFILFLSKKYDNYYMEVRIEDRTQRRSTHLGWNTNTKTRDPMIDDWIALFEDGYLEINSIITIKEMMTFVKKENGKREHADGKHDDSLFGGMIGIQMRKYEPRRGRTFANKPAGL